MAGCVCVSVCLLGCVLGQFSISQQLNLPITTLYQRERSRKKRQINKLIRYFFLTSASLVEVLFCCKLDELQFRMDILRNEKL